MTYKDALRCAYPTYARYRRFHEWAMAHCSKADADTRRSMGDQDAMMYANVQGQLEFIVRMFAWNDMDESTVHNDLKAMYEEREQA